MPKPDAIGAVGTGAPILLTLTLTFPCLLVLSPFLTPEAEIFLLVPSI